MAELLKLGLDDPAAARWDAGYELDVGGVIGRTFSVTWANVVPFFLIGLAVYAPALLILALAATLPVSAAAAQLMVTASDLVERLLSLVLAGALTYGAIEHLRGRRPGWAQTVAVGLRGAGRVFLVGLVTGLATFVGLLLCIVPGIIVACMLWVAIPVAVMERRGVQESLDRSQTLTSGTRLAVFAVNLVMGLLVGAVGLVVYGAAVGATLLWSRGGEPSPALLAAGQLAGTVVLIPFACLQATSAAVGYHDLRVHREGADVEDLVRVFE